ncbi:MAG TPA: hypothetical protein PKW14_12170 [Bacteroidota bacterium]|jgi:hypothetical protein|nr:hypothetical protein [Bacteroidota bacterium]
MMWVVIILLVIIFLFVIYEYRYRKPDELILKEKEGKIIIRKSKFYPKHFSLNLPLSAYPMNLKLESVAKGNLSIIVKIALIVLPSVEKIDKLIRVAGWKKDAIVIAAKELEIIINGYVKEYTEKYGIEELSSEKLFSFLQSKNDLIKDSLGLEIASMVVQSVDPADEKIAEALRQQESARILEQTEKLNQQARLNSAKIKIKTDEEILLAQNELELKKYELKKEELKNEAEIAKQRVQEEISRNRMKLEYEKEEIEILSKNPELLLLTPQAAKLAEASQALKNARTIVNLSSSELVQNPEFFNLFQSFLQNIKESYQKKSE